LKYGNDPGPLIELEFWQNKADNLNSIHEQLQSVEVKNILRFLEGNKSTYNTISVRGITHFVQGEAIFQMIDEWEREAKMFH